MMPRWRRLTCNALLPLSGIVCLCMILFFHAVLPVSNGRTGKLTGIHPTPQIRPKPINGDQDLHPRQRVPRRLRDYLRGHRLGHGGLPGAGHGSGHGFGAGNDKDTKAAHYHESIAEGASLSQPSSLLMHLLVTISFHWDAAKLIYLERMLDIVSTYPTRVDILVVTDHSSAVRSVLASWGRVGDTLHSIKVWQASARATVPEVGKTGSSVEYAAKYTLLWAHRNAIKTQIQTLGHNYSAVFYMEDDTRLDWPAVVSWALDTEVLEPNNLIRCFYRTEVDASKGTPAMLDWSSPMKLRDKNLLDVAPAHAPVNQAGKESSIGDSGSHVRWPLNTYRELKLRDGSWWACAPHRRYMRPVSPFQGLWAASRKQLAAFMAHPYWNERDAVHAEIPYPLGYPERSTGMNLFLNTPDGQVSNCAVPILVRNRPIDQVSGQKAAPVASLPKVAAVEHMRNGYSSILKVPVTDALVFVDNL